MVWSKRRSILGITGGAGRRKIAARPLIRLGGGGGVIRGAFVGRALKNYVVSPEIPAATLGLCILGTAPFRGGAPPVAQRGAYPQARTAPRALLCTGNGPLRMGPADLPKNRMGLTGGKPLPGNSAGQPNFPGNLGNPPWNLGRAGRIFLGISRGISRLSFRGGFPGNPPPWQFPGKFGCKAGEFPGESCFPSHISREMAENSPGNMGPPSRFWSVRPILPKNGPPLNSPGGCLHQPNTTDGSPILLGWVGWEWFDLALARLIGRSSFIRPDLDRMGRDMFSLFVFS